MIGRRSVFYRSERLLLRPIWPEDWQAIHVGFSDEQTVRSLARVPWPYAEERAHQFANLPINPHVPRFMITIAATSEGIGSIGFETCDDGAALELGYWIARPHWGQGYASEAGFAAIELAQVIGAKRLVAAHFLDNPASGRVLRKLGFERLPTITQRLSVARGESVPSAEYTLELKRSAG